MFTIHAAKKLLDRVAAPIEAAVDNPSTVLRNWHATVRFWKPPFVAEHLGGPLEDRVDLAISLAIHATSRGHAQERVSHLTC